MLPQTTDDKSIFAVEFRSWNYNLVKAVWLFGALVLMRGMT